jgi:hypothetical protein
MTQLGGRGQAARAPEMNLPSLSTPSCPLSLHVAVRLLKVTDPIERVGVGSRTEACPAEPQRSKRSAQDDAGSPLRRWEVGAANGAVPMLDGGI